MSSAGFPPAWFPRPCLRQSLTLYRVLTRMGYPVEIHFGVRKAGDDLQGHSWVTIEGKPVADRTRMDVFKAVYSYPRFDPTLFQRDESILAKRDYSNQEVIMEKEKVQLSPPQTR